MKQILSREEKGGERVELRPLKSRCTHHYNKQAAVRIPSINDPKSDLGLEQRLWV
jgi:hypothetical protein